jgi:hypothetical protein
VRGRVAVACLLVAGLLLVGAPGVAEAQTVDLEQIDRLTREGRTNEARAALLAWWDDGYDGVGRDLQQRALWLRARLTVDPERAMREYQRLVVLYPAGTFTDQALFRLAHAAHALGDGSQARAHVEVLARDHPGSPVRRVAEAWLREAGEAVPPAASTGRPDTDVATVQTPAGGPGETAGPSRASAAVFSVQLGAFGEEPRARSVFDEAREAGFEARLVRVEGSPLLHVRVGSFEERTAAQGMFERLAREGLQAAVVRDERTERPVSR